MSLTYRIDKGTSLTYEEGDGNIRTLDRKHTISTSNPTTTDDSSKSYTLLSIWTNINSNTQYKCTDITIGSAVWVATPTGVSDHTALTSIGVNTHSEIDTFIQDYVSGESRMKWQGIWTDGAFALNDVVKDGDWTAIVNVSSTTQRPAPQPLGLEEDDIGDDVMLETSEVAIMKLTHTYTMVKTGWVTEFKVKIPTFTTDTYSKITATNLNTGEVITNDDPILTSGDWVVLSNSPTIVRSGSVFEISLEYFEAPANEEGSSVWTSNQNGGITPASGQFNSDNLTDPTQVTFSNTDDTGVDRTIGLQAVSVGSSIHMFETIESNRETAMIVDSVDITDPANTVFTVTTIGAGKDDLRDNRDCTVIFKGEVTLPTDYYYITDKYVANNPSYATVQSSISVDGALGASITDAYGIDLTFQEASVSSEWDLVAYSGSSAGGGTSSLALGESESTAYRGDRGKIAYDHSQQPHAPADFYNIADRLVMLDANAKMPTTLVGIVPVDDGNGIGYVPSNRNADNFGNIGGYSLDLSRSDSASILLGATGGYGIVNGTNVECSGAMNITNGSTSIVAGSRNITNGHNNTVSANTSIVSGYYGDVSGNYHIVNGESNTVAGDYCVINGNGNTVTATASIVNGDINSILNDGYANICMGEGNSLDNKAFTIIVGAELIATKNFSSWVGQCNIDIATIEVGIGNGVDGANRSNLYEFHTNGATYVDKMASTTANRPTMLRVSNVPYFDTDLGKPIWWDGSAWVDATGTTV